MTSYTGYNKLITVQSFVIQSRGNKTTFFFGYNNKYNSVPARQRARAGCRCILADNVLADPSAYRFP